MTINNLQIALQAIDFISFFYLLGLLLIRVIVLPRDTAVIDKVQSNWQQQFIFNLIILSLTGSLLLLIRVMLMSGDDVVNAIQLIPAVMQKSHYGNVWLIHLISLIGLWVLILLALNNHRMWPVMLMLIVSLVVAWSYSATSHAADQGDFTIDEITDWAHMFTTAVWGGSIIAGAGFLFPTIKRLPASSLILIECMRRLSRILLIMVPIVLLTGLTNVVLHTKDYMTLLNHSYGQILLTKLAFVVLMLMIGAFNRYKIQSDTSGGQIATKLHISFKLDVFLLIAAVICASALIQTMPARG